MRLTPAQIKDFKIQQHRKLTAELGVPTMPDIHIFHQVKSKDGVVLSEGWEQGHSWTRNGWNLVGSAMMDSSYNPSVAYSTGEGSFRRGFLTMKTTAGSLISDVNRLWNVVASIDGSGAHNTSTTSTYGIQIGTSAEPFHPDDFVLWGLVSNGTGSGQMSYVAQTTQLPAFDSPTNTWSCDYNRLFNNNSSASISINEVGLSMQMASGTFLVTRDVLSSTLVVPVGGQVSFTIRLSANMSGMETGFTTTPAVGTAGSGGYYIGWNATWGSSSLGLTAGHSKYMLIVSPKTGGESASVQFQNSTNAISNASDAYLGSQNMAAITALGANSTMGQFCSAANAAMLGGYNDWYIPSYNELAKMYETQAVLSGGEAYTNANYWGSNTNSNTSGYYRNLTTNSGTNAAFTTACRLRLVRRISVTNWVPA